MSTLSSSALSTPHPDIKKILTSRTVQGETDQIPKINGERRKREEAGPLMLLWVAHHLRTSKGRSETTGRGWLFF